MGRERAITAAVLAAAAGCSLTTDFGSLTDGDDAGPLGSSGNPVSSGEDGGAPVGFFDAGTGAAKAEALPAGGVVVARDATRYAAGAAQQHHAHFAKNLGAWVFFYFPAGQKDVLATRLTPDLVSFVDGPRLTMPRPHSDDGRNFDVAYADIGGADVFHLVLSLREGAIRTSHHVRARGVDGALTFDAPTELGRSDVNANALDPDGPSIAVLASRRVLVATGFNELESGHTGNFVALLSERPDDGAAEWEHAFRRGIEIDLVQASVNARAVAAKGADGAFASWEKADSEPRPKQLQFGVFDGATWGKGTTAFASASFDVADFGQAVTSDDRGHIVRFAAGEYVHRVYETNGSRGFAIPSAPHSEGDGVGLVAQGSVVTAVALDADGKALRRTRLVGEQWSAWERVADADATRRHLAVTTSGSATLALWERDRDGASDLAVLKLP